MLQKKLLRTTLHYLYHRLQAVHPFEVQALLLNACNLKCVYCRYPELQTRLLTTQQWLDVIKGLAKMGTMRIKFQGGEPTLRKDFRELTAHAQQHGVVTAVITNGSQISTKPDLADYLDEIVVSVDSMDAQTHDELRGQGSHAQAMKCLEMSLESGKKTYLVAVVTQRNYEHLEDLLGFCESRGIRMHAQQLMLGKDPFDEGSRHLALSDSQTRSLHQKLAKWKQERKPVMFSDASYSQVAEWQDYSVHNVATDGPSRCMAGKFYVHIEANGDVLPCGHYAGGFTTKNVLTDGLTEAIRNARMHDCADCPIAYLNERKALFSLQPRALFEYVRRA